MILPGTKTEPGVPLTTHFLRKLLPFFLRCINYGHGRQCGARSHANSWLFFDTPSEPPEISFGLIDQARLLVRSPIQTANPKEKGSRKRSPYRTMMRQRSSCFSISLLNCCSSAFSSENPSKRPCETRTAQTCLLNWTESIAVEDEEWIQAVGAKVRNRMHAPIEHETDDGGIWRMKERRLSYSDSSWT